tara:strand:- start:529 stop:1113 length:585 start_codon:yes stop_codon:yes gene_type:complete
MIPLGKLSKKEINDLPLKSYRGKIFIINSPEDVESVCTSLQKETVLGFDTETRPVFIKGDHHPPSLIQMAGQKAVYIFQLSQTGLCQPIINLLSSDKIVKCGVAINQDLRELNLVKHFTPRCFVDLGEIARKSFIPHHGLRGLAAYFLGFRISKQARITNWNVVNLSKKQITYAATDAWVGRELFFKFKEESLI